MSASHGRSVAGILRRAARVVVAVALALTCIVWADAAAYAAPAETVDTYGFDMTTSFGATILTGAQHSVPSYIYLERLSGSPSIPGTSQGYYRCTSDTAGTWRSATATTIGSSTGWQLSGGISCGATDYITDAKGETSTGTVFWQWTADYVPPTSPTSTCSSTFWKGPPVASLVSGTLAVRFKWAGAAQAAGWRVLPIASATGVPGTAVGTVPALDAYGSFPGWKGADFTSISTSPYWRIEAVADTGCWVAVAETTTAPVIDPPDYGTDDDSVSCGLNPFCYIKAALRWAFVPTDEEFNGWTDRVASISDTGPGSLMVGGSSVVTGTIDFFSCMGGSPTHTGCADGSADTSLHLDDAAGGGSYDFVPVAEGLMDDGTGHLVYLALSWLFVAALILWAWRRLSLSLGGKDDGA